MGEANLKMNRDVILNEISKLRKEIAEIEDSLYEHESLKNGNSRIFNSTQNVRNNDVLLVPGSEASKFTLDKYECSEIPRNMRDVITHLPTQMPHHRSIPNIERANMSNNPYNNHHCNNYKLVDQNYYQSTQREPCRQEFNMSTKFEKSHLWNDERIMPPIEFQDRKEYVHEPISQINNNPPYQQRSPFENVPDHHHEQCQTFNNSNSRRITFLHPEDVKRILPEFNPKYNRFTVTQWLNKIFMMRNVYKWTDLETLHYATQRLAGVAKLWFENGDVQFYNFDDFIKALKLQFNDYLDEVDQHSRIGARKKRSDETYEAYFYDMKSLTSGMKESARIKYLIRGIPNSKISDSLSLIPFKNIDQVLEQLRFFEECSLNKFGENAAHNHVNNTNKPSFHKFSSNNQGNNSAPQQKSNHFNHQRKLESDPVKSEITNSQMRCFNCNAFGHRSINCTQPQKKERCSFCKRTGHQEKDCFRKNANSNQVSLVQNMFIINMKIKYKQHEREVTALIDTGSPINFTLISQVSDGIAFEPIENANYKGMNNSKLNIIGIIKLECIIDGKTFTIRFHVLPDGSMDHAYLIGREFLWAVSNFKISKNREEFSIVFDNRDDKINHCNEYEDRVNLFDQILHVDYEDNVQTQSEFNVGPFYNDVARDFIITEKFNNLFQSIFNEPKPQNSNHHEMHIKLMSDKPIYTSPRRLSYKDRDTVKDIIAKLIDENVIRKSNSCYASPIVLIKKKNAQYRLCIDYRALNKITVKDRFPLPRIEDCLDRLKGKRVFSLIDLKNGFHHILIHEDSIKYTSFVTPDGQFEYLRMPFGLSNAPAEFQRYISNLFESLIDNGDVIIYIDDILVVSEDIEKHFGILKQVFEIMHANNLQPQLKKCAFFQPSISYLGYEISANGIKPSSNHIEAVRNFPVPKNCHEVHRFVGLVSFFRRFILNFSVIAKPLYDLLKNDATFTFGKSEFEAFTELKSKLISSPILCIYDPRLETELHTDASKIGFGAMLLQKHNDNQFHVVAYFSKRTTESESHKHSYELETLAIIYALKRFHIYLHGIKFRIVTDCLSLKQTLEKRETNSQIMRWSLALENYDYEIIQRSGTKMRHVDALSRAPGIYAISESDFFQTLADYQGTDTSIRQLKEVLKYGDTDLFSLRDNLVYRKEKNRLLFYVPSLLETSVIRQAHEIGHFGINKTQEILQRSYWFPKIKEKTSDYIASCLKCLVHQPKCGKKEGFLHIYEKHDKPFHTIHIDHIGPFAETSRHYKHVLIVVDGFTKFVKVYPTKSTGTIEVINKLKRYFSDYSLPIRIVSDRGSCFTSKKFDSFCKQRDIIHTSIATDSPQSNGQAERQNRTLIPVLAKLIDFDNDKNWDTVLDDAEYAINNSINRSIKTTPSMALFGVNQSKENDLIRNFMAILNDDERGLETIRTDIVAAQTESQEYAKRYFDAKHRMSTKYSIGDIVLIKNKVTQAGLNHKLIESFKGPYIVTKLLPNERYVVEDIPGQKLSNVTYKGVHAPFNMKLVPAPKSIGTIETSELAELL